MTGLRFQNRSEPKPVSVLSPIGENHTQNRLPVGKPQWQTWRAERDDLPAEGMVVIWNGEMDALGVCPSLSSYDAQSPLGAAQRLDTDQLKVQTPDFIQRKNHPRSAGRGDRRRLSEDAPCH